MLDLYISRSMVLVPVVLTAEHPCRCLHSHNTTLEAMDLQRFCATWVWLGMEVSPQARDVAGQRERSPSAGALGPCHMSRVNRCLDGTRSASGTAKIGGANSAKPDTGSGCGRTVRCVSRAVDHTLRDQPVGDNRVSICRGALSHFRPRPLGIKA